MPPMTLGPGPGPAHLAPETPPAAPAPPPPSPELAEQPHPWAETDRPRGLDAPFAPGGEDEASPERVADERRLVRLLVVMVALLVGIPTLLTIVGFIAQLAALRSSG